MERWGGLAEALSESETRVNRPIFFMAAGRGEEVMMNILHDHDGNEHLGSCDAVFWTLNNSSPECNCIIGKQRADIDTLRATLADERKKHFACHEAHVNTERDLAACRETANGLREENKELHRRCVEGARLCHKCSGSPEDSLLVTNLRDENARLVRELKEAQELTDDYSKNTDDALDQRDEAFAALAAAKVCSTCGGNPHSHPSRIPCV